MKEKDLDNLERLFKDGLQHLESVPDDAVWQAVQVGVKKSTRIWKFWGIAGIVVIGLVGLMLFQKSEDAQKESLVSKTEQTEIGNMPTNTPPVEGQVRATSDMNDSAAASSITSLPQNAMPENQPAQTLIFDGNNKSGAGINPSAQPTSSENPEQNPNRTISPSTTPKKKDPNTRTPAPATLTIDEPTGAVNPKKEKKTQKIQGAETEISTSINLVTIQAKKLPGFTCHPQEVTPNKITAKPITKPGINEEDKKDSNAASRYLLSFGAGTLVPSIQSNGVIGDIRFIKENDPVFGGSLNLGFAYLRPDNWVFRSGIEWNSYTNKGLMKYEQTESLEWIDRQREIGMMQREKNYQGRFDLQYHWLSIPIEIGHIYPLTPQFNWEWTTGLGLSYLTKYDAIYAALPQLYKTSEINSRFQLGLRLGFGVNYQMNPSWALLLNTRYQYQVIPVFKDALLTERHHSLAFRFGLQYTLKSKGK